MRIKSLALAGKTISFSLILCLLSLTTITSCSSDTKTSTEISEFNVVRGAVAEYLMDKAENIKAEDLQTRIIDGVAPYIVSIRSEEDFTAGHIPGAVNYVFGNLSNIPKEETVLIYCYTGQSSSFGAVVLGVLGYDVQNLLHGMSSWTTDPDIYKTRFDPAKDQGTYEIETVLNEGGSYPYPILENTASTSESEIVKAAVAAVSPKYITNVELNNKISSGEVMTILDVRNAEHYAAGHIPGAIHIEMDNLADNLEKLNPDAPVYVYCYTGHSSSQVTALLQILGYDAYSLKFGMCSWSSDASVNLDKCFKASSVVDYPVD